MKFEVVVRRIVREDTVVVVEAENEKDAIEKAKLDATSVVPEKWDCYDCEYWTDTEAASRLEEAKVAVD